MTDPRGYYIHYDPETKMTSDPFKLMPTDPDAFDGTFDETPPIDDEDLYCPCCEHMYTEEDLAFAIGEPSMGSVADELFSLLTELAHDSDDLFRAIEHDDLEQAAAAMWRIQEAIPYINVSCNVGRSLALGEGVRE